MSEVLREPMGICDKNMEMFKGILSRNQSVFELWGSYQHYWNRWGGSATGSPSTTGSPSASVVSIGIGSIERVQGWVITGFVAGVVAMTAM
ncbi:hypothetical protein EYZ11_008434 [Aspergillus tanneri]|uniref:Uncharacterized protein n=1 Tax=Aspergillus tanneri TaxID=1220188 RepID=A0A4S3JCQ1_9EURO|nr:hypothetical protein EYZ11_008434 [Aspergillus tanneri]